MKPFWKLMRFNLSINKDFQNSFHYGQLYLQRISILSVSKQSQRTLENTPNYLGQAQFRATQLTPTCEVLLVAGIHILKPISFVTEKRASKGGTISQNQTRPLWDP